MSPLPWSRPTAARRNRSISSTTGASSGQHAIGKPPPDARMEVYDETWIAKYELAEVIRKIADDNANELGGDDRYQRTIAALGIEIERLKAQLLQEPRSDQE